MMTMGMWNDENGEKCLTKNIKGDLRMEFGLVPCDALDQDLRIFIDINGHD